MRALKLYQTGNLDDLRIEEVPPPPVEIFSLEEGTRLYQDIAQSKVKGKPILVPSSKPE